MDVYEDPMFKDLFERVRQDPGYAHKPDEMLREDVARHFRDLTAERDAKFDVAAVVSQVREQANLQVTKLASLVIRTGFNANLRHDKNLAGDIKRRINARKRREIGCSIKDASEEQAREHYAWGKRLEREILETGRIPLWLA